MSNNNISPEIRTKAKDVVEHVFSAYTSRVDRQAVLRIFQLVLDKCETGSVEHYIAAITEAMVQHEVTLPLSEEMRQALRQEIAARYPK
jgi:hypothetical protein